VQREAVHRCSGTVANSVFVTIPGLQRITSLRFVLRCARETQLCLARMRFRRDERFDLIGIR